MKKFAFFTLLSVCLTAIAITAGNSRTKDVFPLASVTNIADTTPKTHHTTAKKPVSDTAKHKTTVKKTTSSKTKTPTMPPKQ
ncbi:MAG: hypothetical protein JO072_02215 [Parafilimonas sp.]|nr:hypothetical protein [Parafilimonas sp.]